MFFNKKVKDKRWKCIKQLDNMSDDDILELAEKLERKSLIMQFGGMLLFVIGIVLMFLCAGNF